MIDQIRPYNGFDYIQAGDPTIDVNPDQTGLSWLNVTTGEIFICIDLTVGGNIWRGQLGSISSPKLYFDFAYLSSGTIRNIAGSTVTLQEFSDHESKPGINFYGDGYQSPANHELNIWWMSPEFDISDYTSITYYARKIKDHGTLSLLWLPLGVWGSLENIGSITYSSFPTTWQVYENDLSDLSGLGNIVISGGYTDLTGADDSECEIAEINLLL